MPSLGDLFITVGARIEGFKASMSDVSSTLDKTGNHATATATKINTVFATAFGGGITAVAFGAANKFQSAFAQIQRATGATGEKLDALEASFTNVYKKTAAGAEQVSAALALLSTRTQATGKDLEDLTLKAIKLAKTQNEDVATVVPLVTRVFGDWSIASNKQGAAMDYLRVVSQQTGTQVGRLAEQVVYAGAPLRALGYSFEQSTALIGKFEKEGVNTELVLGGMKAALQKFAKEGITDTAAAWQNFIAGVKSGAITFQDVAKEVGAKRAVDLFKAITEGRFEIDKMVDSTKKLATDGGAAIETYQTKIVKMRHEVETLVAGHYQLITAVGLGMPVVVALAGAFKGMRVAGVVAVTNIASAIQYDMVPALSLMQKALLFTGVVAAIGAVIANLYLLKKAMDTTGESTPGRDTAHKFTIGSNGMPSLNPYYIPKSTAAPAPAPESTSAPAAPVAFVPAGMSDEEIKKAFGSLGLKDLQEELDGATKAFNELTAAGKLNAGQIKEAGAHIDDLRAKLAMLKAGLTADPVSSEELLKRIGVPAVSGIFPVTEAFGALLQRHQDFVGPQSIESGRQMVDAWIAYGKAVGAAAAAEEARKVPMFDAIEAQNTLNAKLQETIDEMNKMPTAYHASAVAALSLFGAVTGLADAYHSFNMQAPWELAAAVKEEKRQYEILRDSGMASASALDRAFVTYKLHQIELDHILGVTDDELYAQQKQNAEDALKTIDGGIEKTKRNVYDLGHELEQMAHRTFDSTEREIAKDIVAWKGWHDSIINIGKNLAEDFLSIMLKGLFKPLEDQFADLAKKIGGWLGGIFGSGSSAAGTVASTAGTAAGGAGGGAGAVVGSITSGLASTLTAVFSGISAVTGAFSAIQESNNYGALKAIVNHTLVGANEVTNLRADQWSQYNHMYDRIGEIWNSIKAQGAGKGLTVQVNNCTFGAGTSQQQINAMFEVAFQQATAALG
jgi:hypothetical protein